MTSPPPARGGEPVRAIAMGRRGGCRPVGGDFRVPATGHLIHVSYVTLY